MAGPDGFVMSLAKSVRQAADQNRPLKICGGGTKEFLGRTPQGDPIDVRAHAGVVSYEPTELVITVKAGTRLRDLEQTLADSNQMLPFEPPAFGEDATVGGTVACGLSGPARPYRGSVRDYVLGLSCINGKGEALRFGGQVMKNVAGYDVSRLMVGAMGTLGIITEVSFKVLPVPRESQTLVFECSAHEAQKKMAALATQPLPVSASAWSDGQLRIRLSGVAASVKTAARQLGGERDANADGFWHDLKEQRLSFFSSDEPLWRVSLKPRGEFPALPGEVLMDWGGALYWLKTKATVDELVRITKGLDVHLMRFRGGDRTGDLLGLSSKVAMLNQRMKHAFDPAGVLNRGRLMRES